MTGSSTQPNVAKPEKCDETCAWTMWLVLGKVFRVLVVLDAGQKGGFHLRQLSSTAQDSCACVTGPADTSLSALVSRFSDKTRRTNPRLSPTRLLSYWPPSQRCTFQSAVCRELHQGLRFWPECAPNTCILQEISTSFPQQPSLRL